MKVATQMRELSCDLAANLLQVLRCPWLLFPRLHPGTPHALNCCAVPEVLHQSLLPLGPSSPKIPMCHASSAALLVNWGEWQPACVQ